MLTSKQTDEVIETVRRAVNSTVRGWRRQECGDIVNTVVASLWNGGLEAYDPSKGASLKTWVWMVAKRLTFNYLNSCATREGHEVGVDAPADDLPSGYNADDAIRLKECNARLSAALCDVSERDMMIFNALHDDSSETSVALVAEQLGMTVGTVKVALSRVREKVKKAIEGK